MSLRICSRLVSGASSSPNRLRKRIRSSQPANRQREENEMYNPDTYDWYQCDEEDYDSGDAPEERAEGQRLGALIDELTAFDAAFLAEHGVYPAACDLPEHLLCLA